MQAARFSEGADELSVEDVPRPEVAPEEVLVELRAASLCGSDMNYLDGKTDPGTVPLTLGHEGAGVIAETGANVSHVAEGDRVVVHYVRSCGNCRRCRAGRDNQCRNRRSIGHHVDGTFAEYIAIPERCAIPLPDPVSFALGSIAGCAVSTAYHAVDRADLRPGDTAVVFGAGGVGLHAVSWADRRGAGSVVAVDLDEAQLDAAREYGADVTIDPRETDPVDAVREHTDGWGADAAIECSGSPRAMEQAVDAINGANGYESGTVVSVGIQTEPIEVGFDDVREGQLRVVGDHTRTDLEEITSMLATGSVDVSPSITHRYPLADVNDAIAFKRTTDERVGRIVLDIPPE